MIWPPPLRATLRTVYATAKLALPRGSRQGVSAGEPTMVDLGTPNFLWNTRRELFPVFDRVYAPQSLRL